MWVTNITLTLAHFLVLLCEFFINEWIWITLRLLKMFLYSEVCVNFMVRILHNTILISMYYALGRSSWIMYKCKGDTGLHHQYSGSLEVKWLTRFGQLCNCTVIQFSWNGCCPQQTLFSVSAFYIPWTLYNSHIFPQYDTQMQKNWYYSTVIETVNLHKVWFCLY